MLGIGILGGGRISSAHATAAAALPETRLSGVAEVDEERLRVSMERYGCPGWADYHDLLRDPNTDAVMIGLPHWLHLEATMAALEAGKHVLIEKPMAMSVAECDQILSASHATGKTVMVAHIHQFFPENIAARDMVTRGEIGNVVLASDTWYKPFWEGQRPQWFLEDEKGGGMWPMNGPHMIDRLSFFLGERVTAVKARVSNPTFGLSTDMGLAYLQFASGVGATIMHAGFREGVERFEAEIMGTEGHLRVVMERGSRSLWRSNERSWQQVEVPTPELPLKPGANVASEVFAAQLREFALAVLEGRPPSVSAEYGRYVVQVLDACVESSHSGREVVLDPE